MIWKYHIYILFLISFNCISQIIDVSEDVHHPDYKVKLPSDQYSKEDFSLLSQYAFTSVHKGRYEGFITKKNMINVYYFGDMGYKGYPSRKINLSNQKIILRRYAFFEIDVITNVPYNYKFQSTKKLAFNETSKIFNLLEEKMNIERLEFKELEFIELEKFSLISTNVFEDNYRNFKPIKITFKNFFKYRRNFEKIDNALNETLTNEIELFPIYVLYDLGDYFAIYMDLYFSKQNEEIYNETFIMF